MRPMYHAESFYIEESGNGTMSSVDFSVQEGVDSQKLGVHGVPKSEAMLGSGIMFYSEAFLSALRMYFTSKHETSVLQHNLTRFEFGNLK